MAAETNLDRVLKRARETAERLMQSDANASQVLNGIVNQYAMPLMRFKQTGQPPDMESLESLAGKLIAIVAATYDSLDARNGRL